MGLGVGLFVHCMNYIAVSYFGQIEMLWYLQLAIITSLASSYPARTSAKPLAVARAGGRTRGNRARRAPCHRRRDGPPWSC